MLVLVLVMRKCLLLQSLLMYLHFHTQRTTSLSTTPFLLSLEKPPLPLYIVTAWNKQSLGYNLLNSNENASIKSDKVNNTEPNKVILNENSTEANKQRINKSEGKSILKRKREEVCNDNSFQLTNHHINILMVHQRFKQIE